MNVRRLAMGRCLAIALIAVMGFSRHAWSQQTPSRQETPSLEGRWVGVFQVYPAFVKMTFELAGAPANGEWKTQLRLDPLTGAAVDQGGALGVFPVVVRFDSSAAMLTISPVVDLAMRRIGGGPSLAGVLDRETRVIGGVVASAATDVSPFFVLGRVQDADQRFLRTLSGMSRPSVAAAAAALTRLRGGPPEAALRKWAAIFVDEYPSTDAFHTESGALFLKLRNLFRDEYFIPYFGKSFDKMGAGEKSMIEARLNGFPPSRANYPDERDNGVLHAAERGFMRMVGTNTSRDITLSVLATRAMSAWRKQRLLDIERQPDADRIWQTITAIQNAEARLFTDFLPSERAAFTKSIHDARIHVAGALLEKRTNELLSLSTSISNAKTLASELVDPGQSPAAAPTVTSKLPTRPAPPARGTRQASSPEEMSVSRFVDPAALASHRTRLDARLTDMLGELTRSDRAQLATLGEGLDGLAAQHAWWEAMQEKYGVVLLATPPVRAVLDELEQRRAETLRAVYPKVAERIATARSTEELKALDKYLPLHETNPTRQALAQLIDKRTRQLATCGPMPRHLRGLPYGRLIQIVTTDCGETLTPDEQRFVAGAASTSMQKCGFPVDEASRTVLMNSLSAPAQRDTHFLAGAKYANNLGCSDEARMFTEVVAPFLK